MRAQVQRGFGGDEVVSVEVVADPLPGPAEVVVAVRACALNRLDLLQRSAPVVRGFSLPHIAGMDVAGVVVDGTTALPSGTRVLVDPVITCGVCSRCTTGLAPYCDNLRTVGSTRPGGFAELVAVPADHCYELPASMSFESDGRTPRRRDDRVPRAGGRSASRTARRCWSTGPAPACRAPCWPCCGRAGSVVITTAGGAAKVARALEVGYDHAIDRQRDDVVLRVLELTGGRGVDLVVDHVGPALFRESVAALRIGGRMVFCGTTTGNEATVALTDVYHWGRTLIGAGGYQAADFPRMLDAFAAGPPPVIDSVRPFDELADAQRAMAAGDFFGKLVVQVS